MSRKLARSSEVPKGQIGIQSMKYSRRIAHVLEFQFNFLYNSVFEIIF